MNLYFYFHLDGKIGKLKYCRNRKPSLYPAAFSILVKEYGQSEIDQIPGRYPTLIIYHKILISFNQRIITKVPILRLDLGCPTRMRPSTAMNAALRKIISFLDYYMLTETHI